MAKLNLAVIVGSNRRDSINRKLAHALAKLGAGSFEANFPRIDDLPIFNQDLEGNLPAEVVRFKNELARADAVLIVTPEHDRSIPAVLKNAVDWGARAYGKNSWAGKPQDLVDDQGNIGDEGTRQFLQGFIDRYATLVRRLTSPESARSAA
jgi:chromate reductase, NAD(P)H dehydrogenase (quinone)